ncbi:nuclear valosin-containing protein-like, partial [Protobothrops mucrosquamatus]
YLNSNKCGQYVNTEILAAELRKIYSADYGRRKRNAFRIQVEKVIGIIKDEIKSTDLAILEDEYLTKKTKRDENDSETSMDTSDTDTEHP